MSTSATNNSQQLTEHFFRNEYGKLVAVVTRYIGSTNLLTAEDIVQDTLLKATEIWQQKIPENPTAWLYTTAKNKALNYLKHNTYEQRYQQEKQQPYSELEDLHFSDELFEDEQLKMMFVCCHPSISENSQIALILKILCGFSISEIATVFFTSTETINKRLVRGRKQLREHKINFEIPQNIEERLEIVLKTIYLLFTEGYSPNIKNNPIRYDLCIEAIRLTKIIINHNQITPKSNAHALLALMYLNTSRFNARINLENESIELKNQDRSKWNYELIQLGVEQLDLASKNNRVSTYLILASISANHCIASSFEKTDWHQIVNLYDSLIQLEDSPIIRLNQCVAIAYSQNYKTAIRKLLELKTRSDIENHYLYYATLGEFYKEIKDFTSAKIQFEKAIVLTKNKRNQKLLQKKIKTFVPNYKSQLL